MTFLSNNLELLKKENRLRAGFLVEDQKKGVLKLERFLRSTALSLFEIQMAVKRTITSCLQTEQEGELFSEKAFKRIVAEGRKRTAGEFFVILIYRCGISLVFTFVAGLFSQHFSSDSLDITLTSLILFFSFVVISYLFRDWAGGMSALYENLFLNGGTAAAMGLWLLVYLKIKPYGDAVVFFQVDIALVLAALAVIMLLIRLCYNRYWNRCSRGYDWIN